MPAPSALAIATGSLNRLVNEEASYHRELEQQQAKITKLEESSNEDTADENAEYVLRQERKALAETQAVFPLLRQNISEARAKLEGELANGSSNASDDDVKKAQEAVAAAKAAEAKQS